MRRIELTEVFVDIEKYVTEKLFCKKNSAISIKTKKYDILIWEIDGTSICNCYCVGCLRDNITQKLYVDRAIYILDNIKDIGIVISTIYEKFLQYENE